MSSINCSVVSGMLKALSAMCWYSSPNLQEKSAIIKVHSEVYRCPIYFLTVYKQTDNHSSSVPKSDHEKIQHFQPELQ